MYGEWTMRRPWAANGQSPATPETALPGRRVDLTILSLLAVSFMIFQIAVLRELRFQLSTIFTLTPFLFSSVVVFIGLGSLAAGRIRSGSQRILRWSAVILPALLLPLFAVMILVAQGTIDHTSEGFAYGTRRPGAGDAYIRSVVQGSIAVAVLGYGPVFFLQGLIFALYFREGRQEGILSNVYGVDLIASGFGALVGGALNFVMAPTRMVMVASTLLLINVLVMAGHVQARRELVAGATLVTVGLFVAELTTGTLDLIEGPSGSASPWRTRSGADTAGSTSWTALTRPMSTPTA